MKKLSYLRRLSALVLAAFAMAGAVPSQAAGIVESLFVSSGAGAVPRTKNEKLGEIVSVKDFGAKGGGADETAILQKAADYSAARKIPLYINVDMVVDGIDVKPGTDWIGVGMPTIKKLASGTNRHLIESTIEGKHWHFKGIKFDGNRANVSAKLAAGDWGIFRLYNGTTGLTNNSKDILLSESIVTGSVDHGMGFQVHGVNGVRVENTKFYNIGSSSLYNAIYVRRVSDVHINNNSFDDCRAASIKVQSINTGDAIEITGNLIKNTNRGIVVQDSANYVISNNIIDSAREAAIIASLEVETGKQYGGAIIANEIKNSATGVRIQKGAVIAISNNTFSNVLRGVALRDSTQVAIMGNSYSYISATASDHLAGVELEAGPSKNDDISIVGNIFRNALGTATAQGLNLLDADSGIYESNNVFKGAWTNKVNDTTNTLRIADKLSDRAVVLTTNSATPVTDRGVNFVTGNTIPTTITSFSSLYNGKQFSVRIGDRNTTINFSASGAIVGDPRAPLLMTVGDVVNFVSDGVKAYRVK